MLVGALAALVVCLALQPFARVVGIRWDLMDHPNNRSSHVEATPRSGGLGVLPALLVGGAVVAVGSGWPAGLFVAVVGAFGLLGLLDDTRGLPAVVRLAVQGMLGCAAVALVADRQEWTADLDAPLVVTAGVASVVVMVGFVNAFNFMDGVNGISGLNAVVSGATLAGLTAIEGRELLTSLSLVVVAAAVGFLPWNVPQARAFLGDSGSYGLGAAIAFVAVLAAGAGEPLLLCVAPLFVYGVDTGSTLVRRAARGEALLTAHRDHVYQRLVRAGATHVAAAGVTGTASAAVGASAVLVAWADWPQAWLVVAMAVVGGLYLVAPQAVLRALRRRDADVHR